MKAPPVRRHVDALARHLFAPLLDSPARAFKVVSWDAEQGLCLTLQRGESILLIELEQRDEARPCYARTERFNVCVRRQFEFGKSLSAADRKLVDAVLKMVRAREGSLPQLERPATTRKHAVREILVDQVLIPEGAGHYYLNPYVGCVIGCDFCYVAERADLSRHLEGLPRMPWGQWVDVKVNAPEVLRDEIMTLPPGVVRLSPIVTDPYQPIERKYRITRRCLEVLLEGGFVPAILTRGVCVLDDLDLLRKFPMTSVGFSIPSDDDKMRAIFEPGADPVGARIEALRQLSAAGLHTTAVIQPVLPMNVERLVDQLAPLVRVVRIDRMHEMQMVRHLYEQHGLEHAGSDSFFETTTAELEAGFRHRGVVIDDMDNLVRLLGLTEPGAGAG